MCDTYSDPPAQRNPEAVAVAKVGVQVADLTPEMASEWGYGKSSRGAVITEVERGSLAAQNGLRPGMLAAGFQLMFKERV